MSYDRHLLTRSRNAGTLIGTVIEPAVNPNKTLWKKGDFTEIAAFMRQSGEALVKSLGIKVPLKVLDGEISIPATFFRVTVRL